jgi:glycosyltransferase involved in cell wall biosynthesis
VVIPTYNRAHTLRRAIDSVLGQTLEQLELIIVDDGSTDGTEDLIREYVDPRIRTLRQAENRGGAAARNVGIGAAVGEWVAFLDSDDEWLPSRLELQMVRLRHPGLDEAAVGYCLLQEHRCRSGHTPQPLGSLPEGEVLDDLLRGRRPPTASVLMARRSALLDVGGFDERLPSGQDIDLMLRMARKGYRFSACNEVLVIWHRHLDARVSRDPMALVRGFEIFDRKWGALMKDRVGRRAYWRWKLRRARRIRKVLWRSAKAEVRRGNTRDALRHAPVLLRFWARHISAGLCLLATRWQR